MQSYLNLKLTMILLMKERFYLKNIKYTIRSMLLVLEILIQLLLKVKQITKYKLKY